jgi:hypothetical protein
MTRKPIAESDWKLFKQIRKTALERFCERVLEEFQLKLNDRKLSAHERYLALYKIMQRRDKELGSAFNDYRRSMAVFQIGIIYSLGLMTDLELAGFSGCQKFC